MQDSEHNLTEPADELQSPAESSAGSLLVSLSFWCTLTAASLMYAAVSLSPKLEEWLTARDQYTTNAHRLQVLENEVDDLERVVTAMKKDPEFARRMSEQIRLLPGSVAESSFQDSHVDPLDAPAHAPAGAFSNEVRLPSASLPRELRRWILDLATDPKLRRWMLATSAGLTLLAFTLLNESGKAIVLTVVGSIAAIFKGAVGRYFRRTPPQEPAAPMTDAASDV
ncbi:MAG: hypothetical protein JNM43_21760 [Planctomycetaceae bacterium]|nr:hypothetical protein [Planctomycetaceae bacterium]